MKKLKLIISDFHIGRGVRLPNGNLNVMEDFPYDHKFEEFLEYYSSDEFADYDIELIFNGDMINLIQVDYHGHYTTIITERVSVVKLQSVIQGHPTFFTALRAFLSQPNRHLTYIIGNHDQEMMWSKTRNLLETTLGAAVQWKNTHYLVDGIHIEHGHQYEAVNRIDPAQPFLTKDLPEPILNLPWGTLFAVQYLIRLKMQRPYVDKIRPFHILIWWSLFLDTWATISHVFRLIAYFISTRFSKNRYRQSSLRATIRMLLEASVFPDLSDTAKRILRTPEIHTVIFGHTHVYRQQIIGPNKQYINTGSWTDITSMALDSFGRRARLTYARVEYGEEGQNSKVLFRHWIGKIPIDDDAFAI